MSNLVHKHSFHMESTEDAGLDNENESLASASDLGVRKCRIKCIRTESEGLNEL